MNHLLSLRYWGKKDSTGNHDLVDNKDAALSLYGHDHLFAYFFPSWFELIDCHMEKKRLGGKRRVAGQAF